MDIGNNRGMKFPVEIDSVTGRFATSCPRELIRQSVEIILSTQKGERQFCPGFGSNIKAYPFMEISRTEINIMEREIKAALLSMEPGIEDAALSTEYDRGKGIVMVTVNYRIVGETMEDSVTVPLILSGDVDERDFQERRRRSRGGGNSRDVFAGYSDNLQLCGPAIFRSFNYKSEMELPFMLNKLAESYLPEWRLDWENQDIGAAIAEIFIEQMEDNESACRNITDRFGEMISELMQVSAKPPIPARTLIHIKVTKGITEGIKIKKGLKLLGLAADDEKIIFETDSEIYASSLEVKNIFVEKGSRGRIIPVEGEFTTSDNNMQYSGGQSIYERQQLILRHSFMFRGEGQVFSIKTDSRELVSCVAEGKLEICFVSNDNLLPVNILMAKENEIIFAGDFEGRQEDVVIIRKKAKIRTPIKAQYIYLTSGAPELLPTRVKNTVMDCPPDDFCPFGDTFGMYDECLIVQNLCFCKKGSLIEIGFDLSYRRVLTGEKMETSGKLPVIKLSKKYEREQPVMDVFPDKIIVEYNSVDGWRRLNTVEPVYDIFAREYKGRKSVKFYCPFDWGNSWAGENPMLRLQITEAKNCYGHRCIYHVPVIKNMTVKYIYPDYIPRGKSMEASHNMIMDNYSVCMPEEITAISGIDVSTYKKNEICSDNKLMLFYEDSDDYEVYICLDRKLTESPVGMYIMRDGEPVRKKDFEFYYYSSEGFKPLKYHIGTMEREEGGLFILNALLDMREYDYCGVKGFYIKIKPKKSSETFEGRNSGEGKWSVIMNVVEAQNIDTCEMEEYYIEEIEPGMTVPIHERELLKIDLWMDETKEFLAAAESGEKLFTGNEVIKYRDDRGQICKVLVLWKETASFAGGEKDSRVYMLDREGCNIIFGDGIRQKLPRETDNSAFSVRVYKSRGKLGNVEAGAITDTLSNILFIDSVSNITAGKGGSSRETPKEKQDRAFKLIKNHNRLVTEDDYIFEILKSSEMIKKAKTVWREGRLYIYLLMRDFDRKGGSFSIVKENLRETLPDRSDMLLRSQDIIIEQPVFVAISVELWFEPFWGTDIIYVNQKLNQIMENYLSPVRGNEGEGWEIGVLPSMPRIIMKLAKIRERGIIKDLSVTAVYENNGVKKDCRLQDLKQQAMMIPVNGKHKIHLV